MVAEAPSAWMSLPGTCSGPASRTPGPDEDSAPGSSVPPFSYQMVFIRETKLAGCGNQWTHKGTVEAAASGETENLQRPDLQGDIDSHRRTGSALASNKVEGAWPLAQHWLGKGGQAGRGRGAGCSMRRFLYCTSCNPAAVPAARQALYCAHCTDPGSENRGAWPRVGGLTEIIHRTECSELKPVSSAQ